MTYKDYVTAGDLLRVFLRVPAKTIVEIARDPELNQAGPIVMHEDGALDVLHFKMRENGKPVLLMWPMHTECLDERYDEQTDTIE